MVLFQYFIHQSNKFNEQQISKNLYKKSDLVEIKIPVNLPEITNWGTYKRISGAIQLQENWYNYVKLKITRDTLFVMCVPNYKTTRLTKANIIYAREVNEAPLNAKKQAIPLKNIGMFKYIPLATTVKIGNPVATITTHCARIIVKPVTSYTDVLGRPPEMLLS